MNIRAIRIMIAAGIVSLTGCHGKEHKDDNGNVPTIDVARVTTDSVMIHNSYPAYLRADKSIDIVARVNGTVTSRNFQEGDNVTKGQLLFTIEPTHYRDALQQSEAQLATAESSLEYASSHYSAVSKALESNAVSQMEVNQAKSAMEQAQAAVSSASAAVETARTNLGYCSVYAPVSGRITAASVSVGSYVSGQNSPFTLATVYDDASLKAVFSVDESKSHELIGALAQAATNSAMTSVGLDFGQTLDHTYTARLSNVAPDVDKSTGTITFKAVVENPYGELRDGMFVTVAVPITADPHAMLVKDASLSTDQLGRYLYIVNDSNRIVYTPVRTGEIYHDSLRIVTSGVTPHSRYVTKALLKVRDGMTVNPRLTN